MPTSVPDPDRPGATSAAHYRPLRESHSLFFTIRGLRYHVRCWDPVPATAQAAVGARTVLLLHGWMDVSASFQFVVDHLPRQWRMLAPDWRGFGWTDRSSDTYWFPDYLGDLDALLDALAPDSPVDIAAHSMGGNVALLYAGVRPERVRRVVNLEGLGLPASDPSQAPRRYAKWLDALKAGPRLADYPSREAVAQRLMKSNPRLREEYARFLAVHWARQRSDGRLVLLGHAAHKLPSPILYRVEEVLACWRNVRADVLWVTAGEPDARSAFAATPEHDRRLDAFRSLKRVTVARAGHMLHHDQPGEVARLIEEFLS